MRLDAWLSGTALDLAVMRIAVAGLILLMPEVHGAVAQAELLSDRQLWGWLAVDPTAARVAWVLVIAGALAGLLGLAPRLGFATVTLAGVYLLGIPQLRGGVIHYHHLLWLSALLALSPSGDALSVRATNPGGVGVAYGLPVRAGQVVIGLVFFFPGLHKLLEQGFYWDPTSLLYWKWAQSPHFEPLFAIDLWPQLLHFGGAAVVLFELGFLFAIVDRRTRPWAVLSALAFHAATAAFFDIRFASLWATYVIFVDWTAVRRRLGWPDRAQTEPTLDWRPSASLAALLIASISVFGLRGVTQAWPVACYPTFAQALPSWMPALDIVWVDREGAEHPVPMSTWTERQDAQRMWGEVWLLTGVTGPVNPAGLEGLWQRVASRNALNDAVEVRFYRARFNTTPGVSDPVQRQNLLHSRAF